MCMRVVCPNAENIFTPDAAEKFFFSKLRAPSEPASTMIITDDAGNATHAHQLGGGDGGGSSIVRENVFLLYCEFSSERAPRMFRHIRNLDRRMNLKTYPNLFWPHVLVIFGGFRAFYGHCVQHKMLMRDVPRPFSRQCDLRYSGDVDVCDTDCDKTEDVEVETKSMVAGPESTGAPADAIMMMPCSGASQTPTKAKKKPTTLDRLHERAPAAADDAFESDLNGPEEEKEEEDAVKNALHEEAVDMNMLPMSPPAFVHGGYVKMNSVLYSNELRKIHAEMKRAWRKADREVCT